MALNVNQLRSFYFAAKSESITKAAEELMVTPAAITSQVKQLEENLGLRLLFRSGNAMRVTESGLAVFERIRRSGVVSEKLVDRSLEGLERGPWQRLDLQPDWGDIRSLASQWSLRGADLWHLSTAMGLRREIGEMTLLTFDKRLRLAAQGAGLTE